MTLIEAAKLAREALEEALSRPMWNRPKMESALAALDKTIAAAEQHKPYAYAYMGVNYDGTLHGPHLVWEPSHMDALSVERGAEAMPMYMLPLEPVGEVYRYGADSHGRRWHGILWYDANLDVPTGTKLYIKEKNT